MRARELWPFLFLTGTLLFNWPFLDIFNLYLPFYLFGIWGIFILMVAFFAGKTDKKSTGV